MGGTQTMTITQIAPGTGLRALPRAKLLGGVGGLLVLFAALFNLGLCFISTRHLLHASNSVVIAIELVILAVGLVLVRDRLTIQGAVICLFLASVLVGFKLINPALDLKILHDLLIMYVFYLLGTMATMQDGSRVLWLTMAAVLAVGLFELLLPNLFSAMFDVWSYYVDKGVIATSTVNYSTTNLFISGNRGAAESRTFFGSVFGPHRVSSIFLEPVSLGNFSVLAFGWCLSVRMSSTRAKALMVALAAFCFVLADSRFASGCWVVMLAVRFTPLRRVGLVVFCLPVMAMLGLLMAGALNEMPGVVPSIIGDNFSGRMLFSGRLLDYWNLPQWLGFAPSQVYTSDTGYAYFVNNLGLPIAALMLALFAFHKPVRPEAASMKAMIAVYAATSLCIGANMFTIKTAALCWFLYGTTNAVSLLGRPVAAAGRGARHMT